MIMKWTQHIKDPDEKARFEREIRSSRAVLERLKDIVQEQEDSLERSDMDISIYDRPNWAERQAHKNGMRSVLWAMKRLIDLDQQERNTNDRQSDAGRPEPARYESAN